MNRIRRNPQEPQGIQVDKLLKFTQFQRLASRIISARRDAFTKVKLGKHGTNEFDVTELQNAVYGRKILYEALGTETLGRPVSQEELDEIAAVAKFLNLPLTIV